MYCTADIEVAAACAAIYPDGAIYRVRLDLAFPDPDNPINHACGPEGTVLAVEYAQVPLWTQDALMREALRAEARGDITPQVRKALWAMRLTGLG
ncbi:hypothetical protein [Streptomyces sp. NPDC006270]|uniref:hypothetical protein n=1 Tax=Streptomyces sp. NPDC006270 TaxID=3364741 RepID=UPI00367B829A